MSPCVLVSGRRRRRRRSPGNSSTGEQAVVYLIRNRVHKVGEDVAHLIHTHHFDSSFSSFSASAFDPSLLIHFFDFVPSSCQIRVAVANTSAPLSFPFMFRSLVESFPFAASSCSFSSLF